MMEKTVRCDHQHDSTRSQLPRAQVHLASMIVFRRRSALHGEGAETVFSDESGRLDLERLERWHTPQRPLPVVAKWAVCVTVGADEIAVPPFGRAEARVEIGRHFVDLHAPHVARQHCIQGTLERGGFPFCGDGDADDLAERMNAGVRSTGANGRHVRLHESREPVFDHTLHSSLGRLSLPTGKGPAIVLNDQLKGAARHWKKARPPVK